MEALRFLGSYPYKHYKNICYMYMHYGIFLKKKTQRANLTAAYSKHLDLPAKLFTSYRQGKK